MLERSLPAGPHHVVRVRCSTRADGDFHIDGPPEELTARRRRLAPGRWTWLRQVHGATVVAVESPGAGAGREADAAVTDVAGAVLAVQTADCAPVVIAADGAVAIVHAGWRGIMAGVLEAAVDSLQARTTAPMHALLGPCIRPAGYEFGPADLDVVVERVGESARSRSADGAPALDLAAAVGTTLARCGVADLDDTGIDTVDADWFSHRTRGDRERLATAAWLERVA